MFMHKEKILDLSHKVADAYCYTHPPTVWIVMAAVFGFILGIGGALLIFRTMLNSSSEKAAKKPSSL